MGLVPLPWLRRPTPDPSGKRFTLPPALLQIGPGELGLLVFCFVLAETILFLRHIRPSVYSRTTTKIDNFRRLVLGCIDTDFSGK